MASRTLTFPAFDINSSGSTWRASVGPYASATVSASLSSGSWGNTVLTIYRSNDGAGLFNFTTTVTIASESMSAVLDLTACGWLVIKVTTVSGSAAAINLNVSLSNDPVAPTAASQLISGAANTAILQPILPVDASGLLLVSDTAYFAYCGQAAAAITPRYVEWMCGVVGLGVQTAEVGLFSTPLAPNGAGQTLTKIAAFGSLTSVLATGTIGNSSPFAVSVPAGTHLWYGLRTAITITQPTSLFAVMADMGGGAILTTASAGALTAAGPFTGATVSGVLANARGAPYARIRV